MKQLARIIALLTVLVAVFPASAQTQPDIITLNDASPAIDVVITLPPDTTGTVALDFALAQVTLTDANNVVVFSAADERLHGIEFNIAPNSGTHTLSVERLPDVTEATVNVVALPEMTMNGVVQFVEGHAVTLNQEASLSLDPSNPGGSITVNIPADSIGAMTATFPGAFATTQLVDTAGVVLAESFGGHVDGITYLLDAGDYDFTVLGAALTETVVVGVRAVSSEDGGFMVLEAPTTPPEQAVVNTESMNTPCSATLVASSANLRSGPGTGYTVLDYVYRGESFVVGGKNPENNWLVVGTADGQSAWLAMDSAQLQGACANLTVFNIPLQNAAPAQLVITSPGSTRYSDDEDDDEEYEEYDDEHEEHDDD